METITVAASRGDSLLSGTMMLIVTVVVLGVVGFAVFKHLRNRNEPGA